ncbi:hypothetical protein ABKN59_007308 [Abortiporus biennis]
MVTFTIRSPRYQGITRQDSLIKSRVHDVRSAMIHPFNREFFPARTFLFSCSKSIACQCREPRKPLVPDQAEDVRQALQDDICSERFEPAEAYDDTMGCMQLLSAEAGDILSKLEEDNIITQDIASRCCLFSSQVLQLRNTYHHGHATRASETVTQNVADYSTILPSATITEEPMEIDDSLAILDTAESGRTSGESTSIVFTIVPPAGNLLGLFNRQSTRRSSGSSQSGGVEQNRTSGNIPRRPSPLFSDLTAANILSESPQQLASTMDLPTAEGISTEDLDAFIHSELANFELIRGSVDPEVSQRLALTLRNLPFHQGISEFAKQVQEMMEINTDNLNETQAKLRLINFTYGLYSRLLNYRPSQSSLPVTGNPVTRFNSRGRQLALHLLDRTRQFSQVSSASPLDTYTLRTPVDAGEEENYVTHDVLHVTQRHKNLFDSLWRARMGPGDYPNRKTGSSIIAVDSRETSLG